MGTFISLFLGAVGLIGAVVLLLGCINRLRDKQPGCSGNHDCVVYKGEKIQCPSCELREHQTETAARKRQP